MKKKNISVFPYLWFATFIINTASKSLIISLYNNIFHAEAEMSDFPVHNTVLHSLNRKTILQLQFLSNFKLSLAEEKNVQAQLKIYTTVTTKKLFTNVSSMALNLR